MAFISKNDNNSNSKSTNKTDSSNQNNTQSLHDIAVNKMKIVGNMKTKDTENEERLMYLERSKIILNHLEEKMGFDFYDPDRTGGMHLNNRKNRTKKSKHSEKEFDDESVNSNVIGRLLKKIKK